MPIADFKPRDRSNELKNSVKDFAIRVLEEEADETLLWLELIVQTNLLPRPKLNPLLREADERVAIMAASRKSAVADRQWQIS